jgi:protease-4
MWHKVGVTFHPYARGKSAGMLASHDPFTPEQRDRMQAWMDEVYKTFRDHVTAIRGDRLKKPLDELAGGRVFTGEQALQYGLVDRIGTMQDATDFVAAQAKLAPGYDVRVCPEPKNLLEKIMSQAADDKEDSRRLSLSARHTLADLAMPYLKSLDPDRVRAVRTALDRLELLRDEGVVLVMPDVFVTK